MKIDINKIKCTPPSMVFGICVYGEPTEDVTKWINHWGFKTTKSGPFTNIEVPSDVKYTEIFNISKPYKYVDGFSPNLNKELHIGHLSNLVLAKSFQSLGIGEKFIAILGDTLSSKEESDVNFSNYEGWCKDFANYKVDEVFYASKVKCDESVLVDGEGDYVGTKVFEIGEGKIVGIKGDGKTTYFYQDVALAETLNDSTLYMTGHEQDNHFKALKKIHPKVDHIGLGLVTTKGEKMSSSKGNVIMMSEIIDLLSKEFDGNLKLIYNVLAGQILKSAPSSSKVLNMDILSNPKNSQGLYLSFTMASLKSAGVPLVETKEFDSKELQFSYIKSVDNKEPKYLLAALVKHCKLINQLYKTHYIHDNEENKKMFTPLLSDLELGVKKLGMYSIDKV